MKWRRGNRAAGARGTSLFWAFFWTRALLPVCSVLSLAVLAGVELVAFEARATRWLLYAFGLVGLGVAVLHGLIWELLLSLLGRLPARIRLLAWLAIALVVAALQAHGLNAFGRLTGRYATQAIAVLCLALGGNALLALIAHGMQRDGGFLYTASRATRASTALLFATLTAAFFWADQTVYAGLYPQAHFALKVGAFALLMFAFALLLHFEQRWPLPVFLLLVALAGVPQRYRLGAGSFDALFTRAWTSFVVQVARDVTDVDFDGYSSLFDGGDCRPWDRKVSPGAREVPGNRVDDNCFLGDAADKAKEGGWPPTPSDEAPLDVVLITVDALRPDHLGLYNSMYGPQGRAVSPRIDEFATKAVVFENAYSTGGGTGIALGTMLHGMYGRKLRWSRYIETDRFQLYRAGQALPAGETAASMFPLAFGDPRPTFPELLRRRGMYTAAVLDDGFSEMLTTGTGIERGFITFQEGDALKSRDDKAVATFARNALRQAPRDRRLFMWVHFFGTHAPNTPHRGAKTYGPGLIDGYDHEINYLDTQFGRLMEEIDRWPRPIAVILAADHGDVLSNGRYHGYTLHDDVMRIPLLVRAPGWKPARIESPVSLIDVMPTVLALTHTPAPDYLDGIALDAVIRGGEAIDLRVLFADTWVYGLTDPRVDFSAAVDSHGKIVLDRLTQRSMLETRRTAMPKRDTRKRLDAALRQYLEATGGAIDLAP